VSNLLPPNASLQEHALDDATARIGEPPVDIAKLWNAQTCPIDLLPWLAWAVSVDEWDETWTESQKRETVDASYDVHRYKGTPHAIKAALGALGYNNIDILEGDTYFHNGTYTHDGTLKHSSDSAWPLFDVRLNVGFTPSEGEINKIKDRIFRIKNAYQINDRLQRKRKLLSPSDHFQILLFLKRVFDP